MDYTFWLHGSGVQVERMDLVQKVQPVGRGAIVEQGYNATQGHDDSGAVIVVPASGPTFNWFHFPIPTLTLFKDEKMQYIRAYLKYTGQNSAQITQIDIWDGDKQVYTTSNTDFRDNEDRKHSKDTVCVPYPKCKWPEYQDVDIGVVMSVGVKFNNKGTITFIGAGLVLT